MLTRWRPSAPNPSIAGKNAGAINGCESLGGIVENLLRDWATVYDSISYRHRANPSM